MRVPRLHLPRELTTGTRVDLPAESSHYLLRVLRLPDGAEVRLFNGDAGDWIARIEVRGKRTATASVTAFEPRDTESPLAITLVQGISRGQRMDYTLEKSVELGVDRVVPVVMQRTQAAPEGQRVARKARHWAGVLAAAAAQSGRTYLPELVPQQDFAAWLAQADCRHHPHVLLDPGAERGPAQLRTADAITLIAGPEGGFSPQERAAAFAAGCQGLRLGPRILRTETAAIAALAVLQALYGDLG